MKKVFYYESYTDDMIKSKNQDYKLKDNYRWISSNIFYIVLSYLLYYIILLIAFLYCKIVLHIKYNNKSILKGNYFLYSNHTLTYGDIFSPFLVCFPHRPYFICSPANYGIPVIGKLLKLLGALPIPEGIEKQLEFINAVKQRSKSHPIIVYPEAHLWPYYTKIRDFGTAPFHFPVDFKIPVYTSTTCFTKGIHKPNISIYIDGPILFSENLSRKEKIKDIKNKVFTSLQNNSKHSNYEYYKYIKKS